MNKKQKLGPVVSQIEVLTIRQTLAGHFGIYAGKRLFKTEPTKEKAETLARKSLSLKASHYPFHKVYLNWRDSK